METKIQDLFQQIIKYKARRLKEDEDYKSYRGQLLNDLKVKDLDKAFLIGAMDAMIFDMAAALAIGPAYMKASARGELIRKILADLEVPQ